jgi:hypothetical protein
MMRLDEFLLACIEDEHRAAGAFEDPEKVLAECEAHRRIVELHPNVNDGDCETCIRPQWGYPSHGGSLPMPWPCPTLRVLASIYSDQPGFDPDWKL